MERRRAALGSAVRRWASRWLPLVEEVPPELDACESVCRRTDCNCAEWESCEVRRRHMESRHRHDEPHPVEAAPAVRAETPSEPS